MLCKQCKVGTDFYTNNKSKCKECIRKYQAEWRVKNLEHSRATGRKHNALRRQRVLDMYGRKCVCCGEPEQKFLTLEHRNGDGHLDRKQYGTGYMYQLAVKVFDPIKYEILCYNCNNAKGRYGICPHQENKVTP